MEPQRELRLVTCLFVDVVGSTDATGRLGPERMQRLLDEAFATLSSTITAHGGRVEKYIGDAIFALFGAPTSHADDAERALRAAEACARMSAAPGTDVAGLAVRVGVETGEALVDLRAVDERQRMVVGDCVNVAARLQQHADPGQVLVGPTCREATAGAAEFDEVGPLELKGLGAVDAWRLTGFPARDASSDVAFVGRDAELAVLGDAFARAGEHGAVLALIVGPPGQGKSRLASEALHRRHPSAILRARCRPGTETGANTPLRQLIDDDVGDVTAHGVAERVSSLLDGDDAVEVAAAICHSAGLSPDERLLALPRIEQREMIAQAWRRYLEARARDRPLTLLIEDVHWADPVLLRVIDHVTSDCAAPLVVVATARPEFVGSAHLRPRDNRVQIDLAPLDDRAAAQLADVAGGDAGGNRGADAAITRAGGNPLFIIELARSRSRERELPVTIHAAIAARLDELSAGERDLLQRVSIVGETFDIRDAALLAEREPAEVAAALGRVVHLGFVLPVGSTYRFHHVLVRDVAYARLPVAQRMALHAQYAREGVDPADAEAMAHHWWEALRPPDAQWVWTDAARLSAMRREACRVQLAAGRRLEERNAYEEALAVYLRAVELADDVPDRAVAEAAAGRAAARQGRGDDAWSHRVRAIELQRAAGSTPPAELYAEMLETATFNWGYFHDVPEDAQVLQLLEEGIRVARESRDERSLANLLVERASFTGDVTGTDEIVDLIESPDSARFADPAQRMATVYMWAGRVSDALALFEKVFDRLIPAGAVINEPEARIWYGLASWVGGDLERAEGVAERVQEQAKSRSPHTRQHAHAMSAMVLFGRGEWQRLRSVVGELQRVVDDSPDTSFCLLGAAAFGYEAAAAVLAGRALPGDIDARAARMVERSERVQAASVMLPKVMSGDLPALTAGLRAYEPGLRLYDRYRNWDVADVGPSIALTVLERWDELRPWLDRLDLLGRRGADLAEALAAAIREERAAAAGGPSPRHQQLRALGYRGISELLRFRPARSVAAD